MTTYSKETALYDTGAIATDITEAGNTAEKYITKIDDNGIKVHAYDDTNEVADTNNYTRITSNGMEVFQNGESVSSFGGSVRIGKNADAARVNISSTQLDIVTAEGVGALSVNLETEATKTYGVTQYLDVPIKVLGQETQSVLLNLPSAITSGQVVYLPFKATLNGSVTGSAISQINKGTDKQGSVNLISSSGVRVASLSYSYSASNDTISVTNTSTGSVAVEVGYFVYNRTATVPSISLNGEININETIASNGTWYLETYKRLWTNSTPTSNFAAQTILENDTDLPNCDEVRIYYRHSTSDDRVYCATVDVGNRTPLTVQGLEYNRTGGRLATVNSNGITFGAASYNTNSNNTYAIPTKIVGIKYI